jgi:hypothetical protein
MHTSDREFKSLVSIYIDHRLSGMQRNEPNARCGSNEVNDVTSTTTTTTTNSFNNNNNNNNNNNRNKQRQQQQHQQQQQQQQQEQPQQQLRTPYQRLQQYAEKRASTVNDRASMPRYHARSTQIRMSIDPFLQACDHRSTAVACMHAIYGYDSAWCEKIERT